LQIIRQERQNDLRDFIQNSAEEKYKQLDEYYLRCRSELAARPTDLRAFAEYLFRLKTITDEEKVHNKSIQQMEMLCKLLQEMDRGETTADQLAETHQISQNLHAIEEKGKNYKATLPEVTLWCESRVPEMKESLEHLLKKLSKDLAGLLSRLADQPVIDAAMFASGKQVLESLDELAQKVDQCDADVGTYMQWESVMLGQHQKTSLSEDAHKELESTKEKLDQMRMLWTTVKRWTEQQEQWLHSDFLTVDMEEMEKEMVSLHKESQTLFKENCQSKLLAVSDKLRVDVATFKMKLPTVLELGNRDMRPAHWEKLFNLIASTFRPGFTLAQIEDAGIMDHKDAVSETSGIATNEARLIFDLEKIKGGWDSLAFTVLNHRDQAGLFILGGLDEVFSTLEDNQVSLQTMLGDPFVLAIQTQVEEWVRLLSTLSDTIDEWTVCQRNWMYLESIFGAEDIQKQLPTEAQKFSVIDKTFKDIMIRTNLNPKVISSLNSFENGNTLLACFQHCNNDLEAIQKSLEDYLETKRMAFPRFYFLSNDELLGILSQTRDPLAVQPHMSKCFDAIKSLTFEEVKRAHNIIGFSDPGGEYILLMRPVRAEGPVEVWLLEFERAMRDTLHDQAKSAFSIYPSTDVEAINRASWLWSSCAQVTIVIDQILWTFKVTDALSSIESGLDSRAMSTFVSFSLKQIDAMVSLVRTPLDRQKRTLLGALLTIGYNYVFPKDIQHSNHKLNDRCTCKRCSALIRIE
jgi:dynein heavy chain